MTNNLPANTGDYDPYAQYGDTEGNNARPYMKMNSNTGQYLYGSGEDVITPGSRYVFDMGSVNMGWVAWGSEKGKGPIDKVEIPITELQRTPLPKREDLKDYPKRVDADGKEQDPWKRTDHITIYKADDNGTNPAELVFQAANKANIGALATLSKEYSNLRRQHPDKMPVVELKVDSYKHKEKGNRIYFPVFEIVGWVSRGNSFADAAEQPQLVHAEIVETPASAKPTGKAPKTQF